MKLKQLILTVTLPLISAFSLQADTVIEGFYWMLEPSGSGRIGEGTVVGTQFDLENDFGYGDTIDVPGLTVTFGGINRFGLSWLDLSMDATQDLSLDVQFKDLQFTRESTISSAIDATLLRGFYRVGNNRGSFRGSAEIGVLYADLEASAAASGVGSTSVTADGATIYGGLNVEMIVSGNLNFAGSLRYSQFDLQGFDFKYAEYEVGGKYYMRPMFIGGGYRFLGIDARDGNDLDIDIEFAGPVIYGGFRF
jgi:hypothetical protein